MRCRRWTGGGGFWSLTMYDQDYFMPATSPNGSTTSAPSTSTRTNWSSPDGSLTLHLSRDHPQTKRRRPIGSRADGQFALSCARVRPTVLLDGTYQLPNVQRM